MLSTIGAHTRAVRGRTVGDIMFNEGVSERIRVAVVQPVRVTTALSDRDFVHVTHNAVQLIVCGRGTPGVLARVAASRNKPERCVLHDGTSAEERRVPVDGVKREVVIQECKLYVC